MTKLFATILALAIIGNVHAANAGTYNEAVKTCGAEWKASPERAKVEKGHGTEAWQAFRKGCVAKIGWESKSGKGKIAVTAEPAKVEEKKAD